MVIKLDRRLDVPPLGWCSVLIGVSLYFKSINVTSSVADIIELWNDWKFVEYKEDKEAFFSV